jgi:hypothetical protein
MAFKDGVKIIITANMSSEKTIIATKSSTTVKPFLP